MRFGPLGLPEILIILVIILLVFGPRRLPDMAKGIGQSVREFRKGIRDMRDDIERDDEPETKVKNAPVSTAVAQSSEEDDWEALKAEQAKLKAEREAFLAEKEKYQAEHEQPHN